MNMRRLAWSAGSVVLAVSLLAAVGSAVRPDVSGRVAGTPGVTRVEALTTCVVPAHVVGRRSAPPADASTAPQGPGCDAMTPDRFGRISITEC